MVGVNDDVGAPLLLDDVVLCLEVLSLPTSELCNAAVDNKPQLEDDDVELFEDVEEPDEDFFKDFNFFEEDEEEDDDVELTTEFLFATAVEDDICDKDDVDEVLWLFDELLEVVRSLLCSFAFLELDDPPPVEEDEEEEFLYFEDVLSLLSLLW